MNKNRAVRQTLCLRQTKIAVIPFLLLFFCVMATDLFGQSPLDGFDPNANGPVRVVLAQPDGKILIGGEFTTLAPNGGPAVTRNYIARLNPDGTLDSGFDPNATGHVYAMALQPDGKILVGGAFGGPNGIGGQPRNNIARLDPATGASDSFDPSANSTVVTIAIQIDGKILVGGLFGNIGGKSRHHIARLDPITGFADSFDPNANFLVRSIVVQSDGKILAGGHFTKIGKRERNHIARLDSVTGLADSFDPSANDVVSAIAFQADGRMLVGGSFTGANSIGGQTRDYIARLDPVTGRADSFDPKANGSVSTITVQADGRILAGGYFSGPNSIGGQTRNRIARLDATTGLADSFDPDANSAIEAIAVQANGKILAAGYFSGMNSVGGQARNRIVRLESDGKVDQTLNVTFTMTGQFPILVATATQPDGKILIGGTFANVAGLPRTGIVRLSREGTLDMTFTPSANNLVGSIVVQPDGKILVGGSFTSIGGQPRKRLARIDSATGTADSFDPNVDGGSLTQIQTIVSQPDGKLLVGGNFQSIGGQVRSHIARLDPVTGLADSFNPNADNEIHTITIAPDGKILVAGMFSNIGGAPRSRIARLDSVTGLADSFDPGSVSSQINSIIVEDGGKLLVGGVFTSIGGQTRWAIARLDATTGLADPFDPHVQGGIVSMTKQANDNVLVGGLFTSVGGQPRTRIARIDSVTGVPDSFDPIANNSVMFASSQPDGKVLVGGLFNSVGGQIRTCLARLSNDTAALQQLEVTQTTVVWTLLGSSPHCIRVTFELSNDSVNYLPLGDALRSGPDWVLAGLSLPTGTNLYVRARGFYRTGTQSGSESIMESVKNVFLGPMPTPSPTPVCFTCSRNR